MRKLRHIRGVERLWSLVSVLLVLVAVSHSTRVRVGWRQGRDAGEFGSGDLVLFGDRRLQRQGDGAAPVYSHVGMLVNLPDTGISLLWEPVVYDHALAHSTTDEVQHGGSVRLFPLETRLADAGGPVLIRRLKDARYVDGHGDERQSVLSALEHIWPHLEGMPEGARLEEHGSRPDVEGEFSARVMAETLKRLGLVPANTDVHSVTMLDFVGERALRLPYDEGVRVDTSELRSPLSVPHEEIAALLEEEEEVSGKPSLSQSTSKASSEMTREDLPMPELDPLREADVERLANEEEQQLRHEEISERDGSYKPAETTSIDRSKPCSPADCDSDAHEGMLDIYVEKGSKFPRQFLLSKNNFFVRAAQFPRFNDYFAKSPRFPRDRSTSRISSKSPTWKEHLCLCIFKRTPIIPFADPVPAHDERRLIKIKLDNGTVVEEYRTVHVKATPGVYAGSPEPVGDLLTMEPMDKNFLFESPGQRIHEHILRLGVLDEDTLSTNDIVGEIRIPLRNITTGNGKSRITPKAEYSLKPVNVTHAGVLAYLGNKLSWNRMNLKKIRLTLSFKWTPIKSGTHCSSSSEGCQLPRKESFNAMYFTNFTRTAKTGDVLIFRANRARSRFFMKLFGVTVSHAGVFVIHPKFRIPLVWHAVAAGVSLQSLRHYVFSGRVEMAMLRQLAVLGADHAKYADNLARFEFVKDSMVKLTGRKYDKGMGLLEVIKTAVNNKRFRNTRHFFRSVFKFFGGKTDDTSEKLENLFCSELVAYALIKLRLLPGVKRDGDGNTENPFKNVPDQFIKFTEGRPSRFYQPVDFLPSCGVPTELEDIKASKACGGLVDLHMHAYQGGYSHYYMCPKMLLGPIKYPEYMFEKEMHEWNVFTALNVHGIGGSLAQALSNAVGGNARIPLPCRMVKNYAHSANDLRDYETVFDLYRKDMSKAMSLSENSFFKNLMSLGKPKRAASESTEDSAGEEEDGTSETSPPPSAALQPAQS